MWVDPVVPWNVAWVGGALGVYSHVFLDAIMHPDARPWAPFFPDNPFVGLISVGGLNALCVASLLVGIILLGVQEGIRIRRLRNSSRASGNVR